MLDEPRTFETIAYEKQGHRATITLTGTAKQGQITLQKRGVPAKGCSRRRRA